MTTLHLVWKLEVLSAISQELVCGEVQTALIIFQHTGVDSGTESIETKVFNEFLDKESERDNLLEGKA